MISAFNEQTIVDLYKADLSVQQIATTVGTSVFPVVKVLTKHKVRKPNQFKTLPYAQYLQATDPHWFRALVDRLKSKKAIAQETGLKYDMIASLYRYHGIENVPSAVVRSNRNQLTSTIPLDKDVLGQLHKHEYVPLSELATQAKVSVGYLRKLFADWGIPINNSATGKLSLGFIQLCADRQLLEREVATKTLREIAEQYDVNIGTLSNVIKQRGIILPFRSQSSGERDIVKLLQSSGVTNIITNTRTIIPPYELDIYLPDHNLAIEYCGLYWHSEKQGKNSKYHVTKLEQCVSQGIRLLTIFEDEWRDHQSLVSSKILNIVGLTQGQKVNARECTVRTITAATKRSFLDLHHLQGNDVCRLAYGLFTTNNQLVAVMTFSKPSGARTSKQTRNRPGVWELNRFAVDTNLVVRGAAGKLLNAFKIANDWTEIYSYADRRYSTGGLYRTLGFTHTTTSSPNYWYVSPACRSREYRFTYTKFRLVEQGFDPTMTETQIMEQRGYTRVWDCGVLKFVYSKKIDAKSSATSPSTTG